MKRIGIKAITSACVACSAIASVAQAAPQVIFDIRVHGGGKSAVVANPGDVVNLDVYALISGSNNITSDEGLGAVVSNFRSSNGGLLGDLSASNAFPFQGTSSQPGIPLDADSDGDLDVGLDASVSSTSQSSSFFYGFANGSLDSNGHLQLTQFNGQPQTYNGSTYAAFLFGNLTFTLKGSQGSVIGKSTQISMNIRKLLGAENPVQVDFDNTFAAMKSTDTRITMGTPVTITGGATINVAGDGTSTDVSSSASQVGVVQLTGTTQTGHTVSFVLDVSGSAADVQNAINLFLAQNPNFQVQNLGGSGGTYQLQLVPSDSTVQPSFSYDLTGTNVNVDSVTATVPEPGSIALAGIASTLGLFRRKRREK